jgi:hypothetical protein
VSEVLADRGEWMALPEKYELVEALARDGTEEALGLRASLQNPCAFD